MELDLFTNATVVDGVIYYFKLIKPHVVYIKKDRFLNGHHLLPGTMGVSELTIYSLLDSLAKTVILLGVSLLLLRFYYACTVGVYTSINDNIQGF